MTAKKSFTLIEILVVSTIISLLGSIGFGSFTTAVKNSRDAKRKSDLESVKTALSTYYQVNGSYPESINFNGSPITDENSRVYLDKTPQDALTADGYKYFYTLKDDSFILCATLENNHAASIENTSCKSDGSKCNYCTNISGSYLASDEVGPTNTPAPLPVIGINIKAYIDVDSNLKIQGNQIWWENVSGAAPGRLGMSSCVYGYSPYAPYARCDKPTYINNFEWYNVFCNDSGEVRYACVSDKVSLANFGSISIPSQYQVVSMDAVSARQSVSLVTSPTAANSYLTTINFNDLAPSGAAWYEINLTLQGL